MLYLIPITYTVNPRSRFKGQILDSLDNPNRQATIRIPAKSNVAAFDKLNREQLPDDKRRFWGQVNLKYHIYTDLHESENGLMKVSADNWTALFSRYGFPVGLDYYFYLHNDNFPTFRVMATYNGQNRAIRHCYKGFAFGQYDYKGPGSDTMDRKKALFNERLEFIGCTPAMQAYISGQRIEKGKPVKGSIMANGKWVVPE